MINEKIVTLEKLETIVKNLKIHNKKIITTNGVFDILHEGHVRYLEKAKTFGDVLIVGLNSDSSVKLNKGDKRPINGEKSRTALIAALASVNYVFIFNEKDPRSWLSKIKPSIHVKAGDYKKSEIIEKETVEKSGRLKIIKFEKGHSTTKIIDKILKIYESK